jgi:PAS domain S-box-containing protein
MSLGPKILLSIFSLSLVIATIGVTSNWYTNSILNQLVQKNVETTSMVEQTAKLENRLYQSLILLIELKESQSEVIPTIELQSPTEKVLIQNFGVIIEEIKSHIIDLEGTISVHHELYQTHLTDDFEELQRNFQFYEQLSIEWLEFRKENKSQSHHMFSNSLTPYFSNNIIPAISHLREDVMNQQIQENSKLDIQLRRASLFIIVITIILIFLSLGVALFIYNSIVNPLKNLSVGALAFGKGNLDERVEVKTNDEIGDLTSTFNKMASNLQKRTLARDYLDNIIESIQEALIVTDELGDIVGLNKSASDLLAYKKKKLIGKPLTQLLDEELANLQHNSPKAILEHTIETTLTTKHGRKIPVLFSESDLINSKDEFVGKVVVATDITERNKANARIRASLKEKEILLAEIHHRVKNNLAVISGILELQSQSSNNKKVEEALTDSQTRIKSISLVHEMLYQSETLANIN